jgi:hypothetical protein
MGVGYVPIKKRLSPRRLPSLLSLERNVNNESKETKCEEKQSQNRAYFIFVSLKVHVVQAIK